MAPENPVESWFSTFEPRRPRSKRKRKQSDITDDNFEPKRPTQTAPLSQDLWIDVCAPREPQELVVHANKIKQVKYWLTNGYQDQPILFLSGPCGSGKNTTLKVLADSLNLTIDEWINPLGFSPMRNTSFLEFIYRGAQHGSLLESEPKRISLIKEIPLMSQSALQEARLYLLKYLQTRAKHRLVFIFTTFIPSSELQTPKHFQTYRDNFGPQDFIDARYQAFYRTIEFNPVAPTFIKKALGRLAERHGTKLDLAPFISLADGDLRIAINSLQFATCIPPHSLPRHQDPPAISLIPSTRDPSKNLFSALGRVLYDKRQHSDVSTKTDSTIIPLPPHLQHFARLPLELPLEQLLDQIPIPLDRYTAYLHEHFPSFLDRLSSIEFLLRNFSESDTLPNPFCALARMYAGTLSHEYHDDIVDSNITQTLLGSHLDIESWDLDSDPSESSSQTISRDHKPQLSQTSTIPAKASKFKTQQFTSFPAPTLYSAQRSGEEYQRLLNRFRFSALDVGLRDHPHFKGTIPRGFIHPLGNHDHFQAQQRWSNAPSAALTADSTETDSEEDPIEDELDPRVKN